MCSRGVDGVRPTSEQNDIRDIDKRTYNPTLLGAADKAIIASIATIASVANLAVVTQ